MHHASLEYRAGPTPAGGNLESPAEVSYEIALHDISFSRQARLTIGLAIMEIAEMLAVDQSDITRRMPGKVFCLGSSGKLMIEFHVPVLDAEMFVEIPASHWQYRNCTTQTQ